MLELAGTPQPFAAYTNSNNNFSLARTELLQFIQPFLPISTPYSKNLSLAPVFLNSDPSLLLSLISSSLFPLIALQSKFNSEFEKHVLLGGFAFCYETDNCGCCSGFTYGSHIDSDEVVYEHYA